MAGFQLPGPAADVSKILYGKNRSLYGEPKPTVRYLERYDQLQPDSPGQHLVMMFLLTEQLKDVGKKEVELVGMSSGSRTAAGGADFMKGGVAPAGAQAAET